MPNTNQATLDALLSRRSAWPLTSPAPAQDELAQILQAAASAPDHTNLKPWKFRIVQGERRQELLQKVLEHPAAQTPEVRPMHAKYTMKLTTAPTVIVLAASIVEHRSAPEFEQLLSAGAAVMNMLNAAHLLGYDGFWSTAPAPLDQILQEVMGLEPHDKIIGLLNFGTPTRERTNPTPRVPWQQYAQEW